MATTGFWPIKGRLKEVIDYANNPDKTTAKEYLDEDLYAAIRYVENDDKTDQTMYISGINCSKHNAYYEMIAVKRCFGERGKNIAYHGFQSFATGEVTPAEAHAIGMETARKMWGAKYQVVVTTHLNTDNIHNHFVVNSVSFKTGRKFRNGIGDRIELRKISDAICAERNKSVIQGNKFYSNKREYWIKKNGGMTHRDMLRKDIDSIIKNSTTWKSFSANLNGLGYKIVRDDNYEHITIIVDGWKRPVRLDSLGANYTIDAIERRLAHNRHSENRYVAIYRAKKSPLLQFERELEFSINHSHDTATILVDIVFYIILQLLKLTRDIEAWGDGGQAHSPLLREALTFERQLEKEYFFLKNNNIRTVGELTTFCREKESEIAALEAERSKIRNSNRRPKTSQERQEKLQAAREITNKINPLREQLKIADSALERFPKVLDLLKTEHDIEINALTKTNEKGLKNNEKYKENYSNR
jgi:hypothetical protein